MSLDRLLEFSRLITALARVERMYALPGREGMENDVEHSYHLAMLAWYLVDSHKLDLDMQKVIRYALAHDLVEVHAGDTYIYSTDIEHVASKQEREAQAAERLKTDFPEFPDLHASILAYERRDDAESRFVYALDKVVPIILIREDHGRMWRERGVTLEMLIEHKTKKVALSPEIEPYFNELIELLRKEKIMAQGS